MGFFDDPAGEGDPGPDSARPPTFDELLADYWAPDRRERLIEALERDYHAPDRDAQINRFRTMSDAELWPHGKPGAKPDEKKSGGGGDTFDMDAFGKSWAELTSGRAGKLTDLDDIWAELEKRHPGIKRTGSKKDKIELPNGYWFDAVLAAGEGGRGFNAFNPRRLGEGDGQGYSGTGGTLLDPWNTPFEYPSYEPPPPYQPPTAEEAFNEPGFQFALQQGRDALEKSAAARGTLLTTGTLKNLDEYSQGMAGQQYSAVDARKFRNYQLQGGLERGDWMTDYNKALGEFRQGYDIWAGNQDRPFNKLATLAGLGSTAGSSLLGAGQGYAGMYGNTMMGGAGSLGNLYMQGANANAAGMVGGQNAMSGFWGSLGNLLPYISQFGRMSGYGQRGRY